MAASPSGEVDAGTGGCCWSLHRQMLHQHQGCEKHSGIFSDHEWSHLWFFFGSMSLQGSGAACSALSGMTHRAIFFSPATPRTFPPLFPALVLPGVCVRITNQNSQCFTGFCFTSYELHLAAGFFVFTFFFSSVLMELASWNCHKLPLSNDLLVKPTITAMSRPSHS